MDPVQRPLITSVRGTGGGSCVIGRRKSVLENSQIALVCMFLYFLCVCSLMQKIINAKKPLH